MGAAQGATYAVDPVKGDDANPGSAERPWKTMAPVNRLELKGGDKLLVKPGTIVGSLAPRARGSEKKPVVVKFAPGTYDWQAEGLNEEKLHISNTNDAPENREHAQAVHSGISILNNKFLMDNKNGVSLKSAANVLIQGNTFSNGTPRENVRQSNCTDVTVK